MSREDVQQLHDLSTTIHARLNMLEVMLIAQTVLLLIVLWKTW